MPTSDTNEAKQGAASGRLLTLTTRDDGIAVLTFDAPGEPVNTLTPRFADEFEEVLRTVDADSTITAVVVVSGKRDSFIVGANIDVLATCETASDAEAMSRRGQEAFARIAASRKPWVAAISGPALGGGFELALACHARIVTDDKKTVLGLPEVQLGLVPGANGLPRLASLASVQVALDYGLTGKSMRPSKAKKLGVVEEIVPKPHLMQAALDRARAMVKSHSANGSRFFRLRKATPRDALMELALEDNPVGRRLLFRKARAMTHAKTKGNYPAATAIIDILEAYASRGFGAAADTEARAFGELVVSPTARQLIGIFHATQQLKKDAGVADRNVRPREVSKIGMLGAGLMGAGIAYVSANAGIHVRFKEKDDAALGRGFSYVRKLLDGRVRKKSLTPLEADQVRARVTGGTSYDGIGRCDVVIEAVFEDLELKRAVLRDVQARAPGAVFASNTSTIPIGEIAKGAIRPELVVGMHYFSPVEKMPLLEVIRHAGTSDETVATAVALGKRQGKTVIVVGDGPGFYTSRVLAPYMNEAAHLLAEGVPIEAIDRALVDWGWPVGAMTLLDEVGMDVAAHAAKVVGAAFGDRVTQPTDSNGKPLMQRLVDDNRKGRKNKRGLYLYDGSGKKVRDDASHGVDTSVYALLGVRPNASVPPEEIQMRCALAFVNEALRALHEGILQSPRDGDIGAIFGLGFPPFRGGPFRWVDALGADEVLRRAEAYRERFGARFSPAPLLVERAKSGKRFYAS